MQYHLMGRFRGLLFGFGLFAVLFAVSAYIYDHPYILHIDQQLSRSVYHFSSEYIWIFKLFTYIGSAYIQFPIIGILLITLYNQKRVRFALVFLWNYLGVLLLNDVLKEMIERERPYLNHLVDVNSYSFPSGHAMHSLAFFGLLAYHYWKRRNSGQNLAMMIWPFTGFLILLIGISRIYLGVHYPMDIVAGYIAGLSWLFLSICLYQVVESKALAYRQGK